MANNKDFIVRNAVEVGKDTKVTLGTITSSNIDLSTGNYFSDTLAANTTYTISNAGDVQSFQLEVTGGAAGYSVANAEFDFKQISVSSQDTAPFDVELSSDGTKMFVLGLGANTVFQYSLSVAYDISSASYDSVSFSVDTQEDQPRGFTFKPDGTKMYIVGAGGQDVNEYTLSTAWDISTASFTQVSSSLASQDVTPIGISFKSDGTKMYLLGYSTKAVYQYSLSTAWDVSTLSYDSVSFSVATQETQPRDLTFSSDGTGMYVIGTSSDAVNEYTLSTAWDLSTASYSSVSPSALSGQTLPYGVFFKPDGTKMYIVGDNNDTVHQYSTSEGFTLTWPSSIEWAGGVAPAAPAAGETDVFTISTDDGGTSYVGVQTADNLS